MSPMEPTTKEIQENFEIPVKKEKAKKTGAPSKDASLVVTDTLDERL